MHQSKSGAARANKALMKRLREAEQALTRERRQKEHAQDSSKVYAAKASELERKLRQRGRVQFSNTLLDVIMQQFLVELGEELARRVLANGNGEEWLCVARQACEMLFDGVYKSGYSTYSMPGSFEMFIEDRLGDGDLTIGFKVENISNIKVPPNQVERNRVFNDPHQRIYTLDNLSAYVPFSESPVDETDVLKAISVFR